VASLVLRALSSCHSLGSPRAENWIINPTHELFLAIPDGFAPVVVMTDESRVLRWVVEL
jgi:hypothetical protein